MSKLVLEWSMFKESLLMALNAIRAAKLRSILTLLGVAVGLFSIISVMTGARGLGPSHGGESPDCPILLAVAYLIPSRESILCKVLFLNYVPPPVPWIIIVQSTNKFLSQISIPNIDLIEKEM